MNAVLDIGILGVVVLMMTAVRMVLEAPHFRAVAQRKGALLLALALLVALAYGWLLRLPREDGVTVGITFAVRHVAHASAVAVTLLDRIESAVFAVVYFLVEVPPRLGAAALYRICWASAMSRTELPGTPR